MLDVASDGVRVLELITGSAVEAAEATLESTIILRAFKMAGRRSGWLYSS